jgi:hypothetical protein
LPSLHITHADRGSGAVKHKHINNGIKELGERRPDLRALVSKRFCRARRLNWASEEVEGALSKKLDRVTMSRKQAVKAFSTRLRGGAAGEEIPQSAIDLGVVNQADVARID